MLDHRELKTACRPAGSRQSPNHRSSQPDGAAVASRTCFPRLPCPRGRGSTAPAVMRAEAILMSAPQRRSESVPCSRLQTVRRSFRFVLRLIPNRYQPNYHIRSILSSPSGLLTVGHISSFVWPVCQRRCDGLLLAISDYTELHLLTRFEYADLRCQVFHALDGLAVDADHQVAYLQPGLAGGTADAHPVHHRPPPSQGRG